MIEGKGHLEALSGFLILHEPRPGIVDQDMQTVMPPPELRRESPDFLLIGQVRHQEIDGLVSGSFDHPFYCGFALALISARNDNRRSEISEAKRRRPADPGSSAGHQADLPGHRSICRFHIRRSYEEQVQILTAETRSSRRGDNFSCAAAPYEMTFKFHGAGTPAHEKTSTAARQASHVARRAECVLFSGLSPENKTKSSFSLRPLRLCGESVF
jgi:hypothetical protein